MSSQRNNPYCDLLHFSTTKIRIKMIYPAIFSNAFLHLWKLTLNYCYEKILGLDLGTSSIGWALVNEAETSEEKSSIIKLGVRVNPLTVDELQNFEKGKSITTNADRTAGRSMRRNLQRYKLRRENLIEVLKEYNFITDEMILSEMVIERLLKHIA